MYGGANMHVRSRKLIRGGPEELWYPALMGNKWCLCVCVCHAFASTFLYREPAGWSRDQGANF